MPLPRLLTGRVQKLLEERPAVALLGPRQAGKTTLAKALCAKRRGRYFDLELDADRLRLEVGWAELVAARALIVLDEAQHVPELFPRLRAAIDAERKRNGRFLLLGSVSPSLIQEVSQSLAGRLGLLDLTPFLWSELDKPVQLERLWPCGGYPDGGVMRPSMFPKWQQDYLALLTQRDLPQWGLPSKPQQTLRLMRMLAALHGQTWNASMLGRSLGLDYKTVAAHTDFLEGAYLVRRLPPLHANLKKRLVKSPKLYWRDSGLLHALLGVTDPKQLLDQPWVGASWEGYVIEQMLGHLTAFGADPVPYYFRTSDGHEIDLVLEVAGQRWAIEIKLASQARPAELEKLRRCAEWIDADRTIFVSRAKDNIDSERLNLCNLAGWVERFPTWIS
jgi:predicted AAA+ superfamily ATPase